MVVVGLVLAKWRVGWRALWGAVGCFRNTVTPIRTHSAHVRPQIIFDNQPLLRVDDSARHLFPIELAVFGVELIAFHALNAACASKQRHPNSLGLRLSRHNPGHLTGQARLRPGGLNWQSISAPTSRTSSVASFPSPPSSSVASSMRSSPCSATRP